MLTGNHSDFTWKRGVGSGVAMDRFRRTFREIVVALLSGLPVLALMALATRTPEGDSTGFPFTWSSPVTACSQPNPFTGCGFSYSVPAILLDYAVWVAAIYALIVVAERLRNRVSGLGPGAEAVGRFRL